MKYLNHVFALLLLAGLAFAIQPAESWTVGAIGKYSQVGAASVTTEGGNVTQLDLGSNISTEKWAGYWGNVTGLIVLAPNNADMFYTWAWASTDGGEVCAIAAAAGFDWTAVTGIAEGTVDTIWSFAAAETDSATNTLTEVCTIDVAGTTVATGSGVTTNGGLQTCALGDGDDAAKSDVAFCVNITSGTALFNAVTGDYELITATSETAGTFETHYFWLELD